MNEGLDQTILLCCCFVVKFQKLHALASPSFHHRRKILMGGRPSTTLRQGKCGNSGGVDTCVRERWRHNLHIAIPGSLRCKLFYVLCTRANFFRFLLPRWSWHSSTLHYIFSATQWLCSIRRLHLRCHNLFLPYYIFLDGVSCHAQAPTAHHYASQPKQRSIGRYSSNNLITTQCYYLLGICRWDAVPCHCSVRPVRRVAGWHRCRCAFCV